MLRHWLAGDGLRTAGERAGVDRKTAPRTWRWVRRRGLRRDGGDRQLCDELIGAVVARCARPGSWVMGAAWEALLPVEAQITDWVGRPGADQHPRQADPPRCADALSDAAPVRGRAARVRPAAAHWPKCNVERRLTKAATLGADRSLPQAGCTPSRRRAGRPLQVAIGFRIGRLADGERGRPDRGRQHDHAERRGASHHRPAVTVPRRNLVDGYSVIVGHGTVKLLLSRAGMWREISV